MTTHEERDEAIKAATTPAELKAAAEQFGISVSHAYRIRKEAARVSAGTDGQTLAANSAASSRSAPTGEAQHFQADMTRGLLFKEMSTYGLKRSGGMIDEDYDRTFKPLSKKVKVYREMGDDPIVAAVLQAIKMLIRRVGWYVAPASEKPADKQAAEFLESCMSDMSQSWMDSIDQALAMLQYGFSVAELVYKKRQGAKPEAGSVYNDGRIGWRKWLYLAPYSLAPGEPWTFDEHGGLQTINQLDFYTVPAAQEVKIPIDKALLFRTTAENNNPEGRAVLRPMYWPYYIKRNLEEIEAISAERLGAGLPVIYAGQDVAKGTSPDSEFELLKNIVRNVRVDEQMGVALPFAKMGSGAREGEGVLFELITPSGGKAVDFNQVITRYEQRMTMVGLAQFIHLGMNQVGARALGESSQDFFTLSVAGWADLIEETIHRFGTERLMKLNFFPGITGYPRITHESIVRKSLAEMADYINKLVGSMVITPDENLEKYLRELAELPERDKSLVVSRQPAVGKQGDGQTRGSGEGVTAGQGDAAQQDTVKPGDVPKPEDGEQPAEGQAADLNGEAFAQRGAGKPGRRTKQIDAVNAYQQELQDTYEEWADELSGELAKEDDDNKRNALIAAALAALLASLVALGRKRLTEAFTLALGGNAPSPEMLTDLAEALRNNESFLTSSLIPAIGSKLKAGLWDADIIAALEQSDAMGAEAIKALLDTLRARTGSYSGNWWAIYNHTIGLGAGGKVAWYLDNQAKHCGDCPRFGSVSGTVYDSYEAMLQETGGAEPASGVECGSNCRCEVRPVE